MPRRASRVAGWASMAMAAGLLGCGNSRTPVPTLSTPVPPRTVRELNFPASGVQITAPSDWVNNPGVLPLVTTISLSSSVAALWRYPRSAPPPSATPPRSRPPGPS